MIAERPASLRGSSSRQSWRDTEGHLRPLDFCKTCRIPSSALAFLLRTVAGHVNTTKPHSSEPEVQVDSEGQQLGSNAGALREIAAQFTRDAAQLASEFLWEADFTTDFPNIFGDPAKVGEEVAIRNQCGLLLHKANFHVKAALVANSLNNIHSLAVQLRVVLECAAQVQSIAHAAEKGTEKEVRRVSNVNEYNTAKALRALSRGQQGGEEFWPVVLDARQAVGDHSKRKIRRVTIKDHLTFLKDGPELYDLLSTSFCAPEPKFANRWSALGDVSQPPEDVESFMFGYLLDCLAGAMLLMAIGYGFLLIAVNGDSKPFDDAVELMDKKRMAVRSLRPDA